ncbi:MlaA family lipoprotein [Pedomonas mirosovicensis]|uniref:MlaA family lipoprotein n=1 Tax=Pedomonas mirosovicensis TaxID=2908641 RepID=UPI00216A554F|nr:MlaA family lipoprotein [Pedomonas mirosovicensis]MCH8685522.1 MlaA family lipoprotein [Pedomonas mirosovicensis]
MTANGRTLLVGTAAMLALSISLTGPVRAAEDDPFEETNRSIHEFNMEVDRLFLKPVAKGYRAITPKPVRKGVTNFLSNLREPFTFINALLQAKPDVAVNALGRFLINTTIGIAGLTDPATDLGVKAHHEDFGQTLATWGVPEGPYLVLPFLGPSNPRDFVGDVVQFVGDPASIVIEQELGKEAYYGTFAVRVVDMRSNAIDTIDPLLDSSDDPYVFIRSAYKQNRAFAISDGAISAPSEEEDIFGDDTDAAPLPSDVLSAPAQGAVTPATPTPENGNGATTPDDSAPAAQPAPDTQETPGSSAQEPSPTPPAAE